MKPILCFFLLLGGASVFAQDPYFSQISSNPQSQNAALVGLSEQRLRGGTAFRSQWSSILRHSDAYKTGSAWADFNKGDCQAFGFGISLLSDKSGGSFLQQRGQLSLSYQKPLSGNMVLSVGGAAAFQQNRLDFSEARFVSQYESDGQFNPNLTAPIPIDSWQKSWFDAAVGILLAHENRAKQKWLVGIAADHLPRPNVSFFKNNSVRLPIRFNGQLGFETPLSKNQFFQAQITSIVQGKFWQVNSGVGGRFEFDGFSWATGASCRFAQRLEKQFLADAAVLTQQFGFENFAIGMSYDWNISPLSAANRWNNAFEINFIYLGQKKNKNDCISCYKFFL